jgi:hypothetical protein
MLAVTIFAESAMKDTPEGAAEMGAIASVIMNRYNIVNGFVTMRYTDGSIRQPPTRWGAADKSLKSILNPSQFEVWQGPGGHSALERKRAGILASTRVGTARYAER